MQSNKSESQGKTRRVLEAAGAEIFSIEQKRRTQRKSIMVAVPNAGELREKAELFLADYEFILDEHGMEAGIPLLAVPLEGDFADPFKIPLSMMEEGSLDVTGDLAIQAMSELQQRIHKLQAAYEAIERRWNTIQSAK